MLVEVRDRRVRVRGVRRDLGTAPRVHGERDLRRRAPPRARRDERHDRDRVDRRGSSSERAAAALCVARGRPVVEAPDRSVRRAGGEPGRARGSAGWVDRGDGHRLGVDDRSALDRRGRRDAARGDVPRLRSAPRRAPRRAAPRLAGRRAPRDDPRAERRPCDRRERPAIPSHGERLRERGVPRRRVPRRAARPERRHPRARESRRLDRVDQVAGRRHERVPLPRRRRRGGADDLRGVRWKPDRGPPRPARHDRRRARRARHRRQLAGGVQRGPDRRRRRGRPRSVQRLHRADRGRIAPRCPPDQRERSDERRRPGGEVARPSELPDREARCRHGRRLDRPRVRANRGRARAAFTTCRGARARARTTD